MAGYPFRFGRSVFVQRAARVTDPYSGEDEYLDWNDITETEIPKTAIEPRTTDEPLAAGRAPVYVGVRVHGPVDMDITPQDRVRIDGVVYEVDGEVARWHSPFTGSSLGTVNLVRKDG